MATTVNRAIPLAGLLLGLLACTGCRQEPPDPVQPLLLPGLMEKQDSLQAIRLRGAGNAPLVTLVKSKGAWLVRERDDWPADAGLVSQYLFVLSQAHRSEPKTANPTLYSRLSVEPVALATATGTELELSAANYHARLLIGRDHPKFDRNYVRVDGGAQSWLTDLPVDFDRNPSAWLDHRLLDLPLARIGRVHVRDTGAGEFSISHRDDRFRLDGIPSAAMGDSQVGDVLAGALDQFRFEDVADDQPSATPVRVLTFEGVDGLRVTMALMVLDGGAWVRVATSMDEAAATAWAAKSGADAASVAELRQQATQWNSNFEGKRFLLPASSVATFMLGRDAILAGAPAT